jgi:molecular chaperone GrpE
LTESIESSSDEATTPPSNMEPTSEGGDGSKDVDWQSRVRELERQLEDEKRRNAELSRNTRYLQADIVNLQRQSDRMVNDAKAQARITQVLEMISVLEDLNRAIAVSTTESDSDPLMSGIKLLRSNIEAKLRRENVERMSVESGEKLDPTMHDAVAFKETGDQKEGTIVSVISFGYTMAGKVIKPALVEVARAPRAQGNTDDSVGSS